MKQMVSRDPTVLQIDDVMRLTCCWVIGDSFDASFDTEGFSAELFNAYLERKGGFDQLGK